MGPRAQRVRTAVVAIAVLVVATGVPVVTAHAAPAPATPPPAWTDRYLPGAMLDSDAAGNLYVASGGGASTSLISYDPDGVQRWRRDQDWVQYRSIASSWVAVAPTGDVIWVKEANTTGQPHDALVTALSPTGALRWQRTVAMPPTVDVRRADVGPSGEVYVAGASSTANLGALLALAPDGTPQWLERWGGMRFVDGLDVGPDGTIVVAGGISGAAEAIAFDPQGNRRWRTGALSGSVDTARDVAFSPDGTNVHVAYTGGGGLTVATISGAGDPVWDRSVTRPGLASVAGRIAVAPNGDVVVAGAIQRPQPLPYLDLYTVRLRGDGSVAWDEIDDVISDNDELAGNVAIAPDGTAVLTAVRAPGSSVVAYRPDGTVDWRRDHPDATTGRWVEVRADGAACTIAASGIVACFDPTAAPPTGNLPPVAHGTFTRNITSPDRYHVSTNASDPDGSVVRATWDFGDGTSTDVGPSELVSHTYEAPGAYDLTLTVVDDDGATDTQRWLVLHDTRDLNLASDVVLDVRVDGLEVTVDGTASSDADGVVAHEWHSGDGALAFTAEAAFTFEASGTYQVMLVITDGEGSRTARTELVTVTGSTPPPAAEVVLVSSTTSGTVGGQRFADEDIVALDTGTATWSTYVDGSDIGLRGNDIDGFEALADGTILLSLDRPARLQGRRYDDSDVIRFTPTSTGATTAGTFSMAFDGSRSGLSTDGEDVDAVATTDEGDLLISVRGRARTPTVRADDSDVLVVGAAGLLLHLDGAGVDLTTQGEDVGGVTGLDDGTLALSTKGRFRTGGIGGVATDILACVAGAGPCDALEHRWRGAAAGLIGEVLDGHDIIG